MQSLHTLMTQLERSPAWRSNASFRQLLAQWPQLVGAAVAQHSQPTKVQRGVLQVTVSSAAWAQTLTFERYRILQKLRQQMPAIATEIQDMRFTTARWRQDSQRARPPARTVLNQHPSWVAAPTHPSQVPPQTAAEAFQRWAHQRQAQLAHQSRCPRCQRPCPSQELQRWSACAICMSQQWHGRSPR